MYGQVAAPGASTAAIASCDGTVDYGGCGGTTLLALDLALAAADEVIAKALRSPSDPTQISL